MVNLLDSQKTRAMRKVHRTYLNPSQFNLIQEGGTRILLEPTREEIKSNHFMMVQNGDRGMIAKIRYVLTGAGISIVKGQSLIEIKKPKIMTRAQLNKANEIDRQINTLEKRRQQLATMIKDAFDVTRPDPYLEDEDEFKALKVQIYQEIDITFNKKLRDLEGQIAEI